MSPNESAWVIVGLTGQLLFSGRFLVQWLASERLGTSVLPRAFWYFSLAGGMCLLAYALWRADPVFIAGQSLGLAVYARNLQLSRGRQAPLELVSDRSVP